MHEYCAIVFIFIWFSQYQNKILKKCRKIFDFWKMSEFSSKNIRELGSRVPDFLHVWSRSLWDIRGVMGDDIYRWIRCDVYNKGKIKINLLSPYCSHEPSFSSSTKQTDLQIILSLLGNEFINPNPTSQSTKPNFYNLK